MKVGDLVKTTLGSPGSMAAGALGLIIDKKDDKQFRRHPRWVIHWLVGNEIDSGFHVVRESVTYGDNIEVISESR